MHSLNTLIIAALFLFPLATSADNKLDLAKQKKDFIDEMVSKHQFDQKDLSQLLDEAKFKQSIIDAMTRPAEGKAWYEYRPIFLTKKRIEGGVKFWNENTDLLKAAEAKYGVPAEIIVAIVGVETRYGGYTGKYRIIDSLITLAFGYPKRSKFFRKELEAFLILANEEDIDPRKATGSYAGAMGWPQFIASSYRRYAVDFDNDGKRDLWSSKADIIGSVASYFSVHGWSKGEPITQLISGASDKHQKYVDAGMKPSLKVGELRKSGIRTSQPLPPTTTTSLIKLEQKDKQFDYWLGLDNFYVITRYNHSNLYSMAVYQLSEEIKALKNSQGKMSAEK